MFVFKNSIAIFLHKCFHTRIFGGKLEERITTLSTVVKATWECCWLRAYTCENSEGKSRVDSGRAKEVAGLSIGLIDELCPKAKSIRRYVIRAGVVLTNLASKGSILDRVMTTDPEFDDPSVTNGFPYLAVALTTLRCVSYQLQFEVVSLACALRVEFVKEVIEFTLGVAVAPSFLLIRCHADVVTNYIKGVFGSHMRIGIGIQYLSTDSDSKRSANGYCLGLGYTALPRIRAVDSTVTMFYWLGLLCFVALLQLSLSGQENSFESVPDLEKSMYVAIDGYPCVRLLNISGEIGCSNPGRGNVVAPVVRFKDTIKLDKQSAILTSLEEFDSFFTRFSSDPDFAKHVAGMLVESGTQSTNELKGFSPDKKFPLVEFAPYNSGTFEWNPTGSGVMWEAYNFPVFLLSESSTLTLREVAIKNEKRKNSYTSNVVDFDLVMQTTKSGTRDSESCLRQQTCLPLGGYRCTMTRELDLLSVWSALPPINLSSEKSRPVILAVASMDSASFFRDRSIGADSPISVVDALSHVDYSRNFIKQVGKGPTYFNHYNYSMCTNDLCPPGTFACVELHTPPSFAATLLRAGGRRLKPARRALASPRRHRRAPWTPTLRPTRKPDPFYHRRHPPTATAHRRHRRPLTGVALPPPESSFFLLLFSSSFFSIFFGFLHLRLFVFLWFWVINCQPATSLVNNISGQWAVGSGQFLVGLTEYKCVAAAISGSYDEESDCFDAHCRLEHASLSLVKNLCPPVWSLSSLPCVSKLVWSTLCSPGVAVLVAFKLSVQGESNPKLVRSTLCSPGVVGECPIPSLVGPCRVHPIVRRVCLVDGFWYKLVFVVFTGESWGYLGSRRFLLELDQHSDAVRGLDFSMIETVLEIGSVGKSTAQDVTTFFAHTTGGAYTNETLNALFHAQDSLKTQNIKISKAKKTNPGLPPSSLMAFVRKNPQTSGIVLEDFDDAYRNKFYHSHLDDQSNVNSSAIVAAASLVARSLYILASDKKEVNASLLTTINANSSLVEELLGCLLSCEPGLSCGLVKSYIAPSMSCPSHYVGVILGEPSSVPYLGNVGDVSRFIWNFLAEKTSIRPTNTSSACPKDCGRDGEACIQTETDGKGICVISTTRYIPAYSTRLKYESDTWMVLPSNSTEPDPDPVWTESNWDMIRLRAYTVQGASYDRFVLLLGIVVTVLAYLIIVMARAFITKAMKCD
nr:nicastrin isoform X2 [Ipomoea batatas]